MKVEVRDKVILYLFNFFSSRKNKILVSILIGIMGFSSYTICHGRSIQNDLRDNLIRFHVLANSDTKVDQDLKIYVKNEILKKYRDDLKKIISREDAISFLQENKYKIETYANELIIQNGFDYKATVGFEEVNFPTKTYGDITLPEGEYLAFRVLIGSGEGKNYWCVMYPPLCYVEGTYELSEEAQKKLEENLTEEEMDLIRNKTTIKFKLVELFN